MTKIIKAKQISSMSDIRYTQDQDFQKKVEAISDVTPFTIADILEWSEKKIEMEFYKLFQSEN